MDDKVKIRCYENGEKVSSIACAIWMKHSTISSMIRNIFWNTSLIIPCQWTLLSSMCKGTRFLTIWRDYCHCVLSTWFMDVCQSVSFWPRRRPSLCSKIFRKSAWRRRIHHSCGNRENSSPFFMAYRSSLPSGWISSVRSIAFPNPSWPAILETESMLHTHSWWFFLHSNSSQRGRTFTCSWLYTVVPGPLPARPHSSSCIHWPNTSSRGF